MLVIGNISSYLAVSVRNRVFKAVAKQNLTSPFLDMLQQLPATYSEADSDIRWKEFYRDNGYDFLVLSGHNKFNTYASVQATIDAENNAAGRKKFLLIPGEEVTDKYGAKNVHLGAININSVVPVQGGTIANIVSSLEAGNFYASTGVTYSDVSTVNNVMSMTLTGAGPFTTTFIGKDGALLKTETGNSPSYTLPTEGQLYVRAKTNASTGSAWTQPLYDKSYIVDNAGSGFSASSSWVTGTSGSDKYKTNYHYRSTLKLQC